MFYICLTPIKNTQQDKPSKNVFTHLFIEIPRYIRILHGGQEGVSLHPSYKQLPGWQIRLLMIQVEPVPSNHVWQHEGVASQVHLQRGRDDGGETVV